MNRPKEKERVMDNVVHGSSVETSRHGVDQVNAMIARYVGECRTRRIPLGKFYEAVRNEQLRHPKADPESMFRDALDSLIGTETDA